MKIIKSIKSCGIVPILKHGKQIKFLLIQHRSGHWSFPKGRMKKGETEVETAKREFQEEVGIKDFEILNSICFTEKYSFIKSGRKYNKKVKYFLAIVKNPEVKLSKSELEDHKWLRYEKAMDLVTYEGVRKILKKANKLLVSVNPENTTKS